MVNKPISKMHRDGPPPIDESWWTAILSEDDKPAAMTGSAGPGEAVRRREARQVGLNWDRARAIYEGDEAITLRVTGFNRGGLLVEGNEILGFVPLSHLVAMAGNKSETEREDLLSRYVHCYLTLKVIECDPERGRVVLSERAALSEPGRRTRLLETLSPGDRYWGTVTNITDFGAFVDLGGLEGLIHVSELSWGRVRHPADMLQLGDRIEVYVISVDRGRLRVALSLKRLHPNPWETAEEKYIPGQVVEAIITSILPFGAFARLEEGLDGLIHVSEMGEPHENINPSDFFFEGQSVKVRILQVNSDRQRLGLSLVLD
jgi:small subunit ribosomal protein S1